MSAWVVDTLMEYALLMGGFTLVLGTALAVLTTTDLFPWSWWRWAYLVGGPFAFMMLLASGGPQ